MMEDLMRFVKAGPAVGARVSRCSRPLRGFAFSQAGTVSIELALVAIILAVLAFGAFDFSRYSIETTRIINAARAGAQYGIQDEDSAADATAIEAAVRADAEDAANELSVTVEEPFCLCPTDVVTACSADCADGSFAPMYVEVTVVGQMEFLFDLPGVPAAADITGFSRMRVR